MVARRLEAESVSAGLATELTETWGILQAESDEHDILRAAIGVVFDDLGVAQPEGTSSLEEDAFQIGITQAFTVACSHYAESIDLEAMSLGFAPGYEASELDEIETTVTPIARNLVNIIKDIALPRRG